MNEQWINDIKNKLKNQTRPVPDQLWERIAADIPQQRKKRFLIMPLSAAKRIAAAAAVVLAIGLTWLALRHDTSLAPVSVDSFIAGSDMLTEQASDIQENAINPAEIKESVGQRHQSRHIAASDVKRPAETTETEITETETEKQNEESVNDSIAPIGQRPTGKAIDRNTSHFADNMPVLRPSKNDNRVAISLSVSNPGESSYSTGGYAELTSGSVFPSVMSAENMTEGSAHPHREQLREIMYSNLDKKPESKINHKLPLRASVAVQYPLTERFSVETGLTYTLLRSTLFSGSGNNRYEAEQSLNYIGIPLKAVGTLWQNDRWKIYASAGGMVEKCVSGKSDITYFTDNGNSPSESTSVNDRRLQFSVNGSAGVQVALSHRFGIYFEPGVSYHFNNGSNVDNLYKDRPFNLNLNAGVRVTLGKTAQ